MPWDDSGVPGCPSLAAATCSLLASEITVVSGRRHNLALLVALALAPLAIGIAVRASSPNTARDPIFQLGHREQPILCIHGTEVRRPAAHPLIVGVVVGDSITGEAGTGTLRYLFAAPVTRGRLLSAKAVSVLVDVAVATVAVTIVGIVATCKSRFEVASVGS